MLSSKQDGFLWILAVVVVLLVVVVGCVYLGSCIRKDFCEAQARVRQGSARNGPQGKRPQSLNWSLELTLKLVATFPPTQKSHYTSLMARQLSGEAGGGKGRCVGSLWVTLGSL